MTESAQQVVSELVPFLRVLENGKVERFLDSPFVPPSPKDPTTGVSSKDIAISTAVSARLYLPNPPPTTEENLPILLYFHGGGFCIESAFSLLTHNYINSLVSHAKIIALSVEYRLAPEHPLPIAYEDSWVSLQWVASHLIKKIKKQSTETEQSQSSETEPWLTQFGDFDRVYVGGDSSGANIAHNIAMRASIEGLIGGMKIHGVLLCHPFFWGSDPTGSEPRLDREKSLPYRTWKFVFPSAKGGIDDPMINPMMMSLGEMKCGKLLVCVAGKDELRDRGVGYWEEVKRSGWNGELEFYEEDEEGHCFHALNPASDNAKKMMKRLASFLV